MSFFYRYFGLDTKVEAASMLMENDQNNESLENAEQDVQKKKKSKRQKIGFRDRKVY